MLQKSAKSLLQSTNIINILSKFGEVHIVGSYAFNLMIDPDIDLVVVTDDPEKNSEEALAYISKLHLFQKLEYGDFKKFPRNNRPSFFILNMKTPWENEMFEIETWFIDDAKDKIDFVEYMKNISPEQIDEILKLKIKRKIENIDKKKLSSFDIYKKVLCL